MTGGDQLQQIEQILKQQSERLLRIEKGLITEASPWLTIDEAAAYLRISDRTLRRAVRDGAVRAYRVGGKRELRFQREDLDAFMQVA